MRRFSLLVAAAVSLLSQTAHATRCFGPQDCPAPSDPCRVAICAFSTPTSTQGTCKTTKVAVDDGDPSTCDVCSAGAVLHLPMSTTKCMTDSCHPNDTGNWVHHTPKRANTRCDDLTLCNGIERCDGAGNCLAGTPVQVDDGNACTIDGCIASSGKATHTAVSVDDGDACTLDACTPTGGVTHTPIAQCGGNAPPFVGLPIVVDGSWWGKAEVDDLVSPFFAISVHAQAKSLARDLNIAAALPEGAPGAFRVECTGACPPDAPVHAPGAPAIWLGVHSDFPDDPDATGPFSAYAGGSVPMRERERFVVRSTSNGYYLLGATERGTDHARAALLEELGFRHFMVGEAWDIPGTIPTGSLSLARDETPAFVRRAMQPKGFTPASGAFINRWLRNNRAGDASLRRIFGQAIRTQDPDTVAQEIYATAGTYAYVWADAMNAIWGMGNPIPASVLANGGRSFSLSDGSPNPDAVAYYTALARAFFTAYPHADLFSLGMGDDQSVYCGGSSCCDAGTTACTKATDAYLLFANALAESLATCTEQGCGTAERPRYVWAFLYKNTGSAPSPTMTIHPRVVVEEDIQDGNVTGVGLPVLAPALAAAGTLYGLRSQEQYGPGVECAANPSTADCFLRSVAAREQPAYPTGYALVTIEHPPNAVLDPVHWRSLFRYGWSKSTTSQVAAIRADFFEKAFPEPTSRERMKEFYDVLDFMQIGAVRDTPFAGGMARLYRLLAAARAAAATCPAAVCGTGTRFERMMARLDGLALWVRRQELEYRNRGTDNVEGAGWQSNCATPTEALELLQFAERTPVPTDIETYDDPAPAPGDTVSVTNAYLLESGYLGAYAHRCDTTLPAQVPVGVPFSSTDAQQFLATGATSPLGFGTESDYRLPRYSGDLRPLPSGVPVACSDGSCGALADVAANGTTSALDYVLAVPSGPVPPIRVVDSKLGFFVDTSTDHGATWTRIAAPPTRGLAAANCTELALPASAKTSIAALPQGALVRLRAKADGENTPGLCVDANDPPGAYRMPRVWTNNYEAAGGGNVFHVFVPTGLTELAVYGLAGACLVAPDGQRIGVPQSDGTLTGIPLEWPCPTETYAPLGGEPHARDADVTTIPVGSQQWGVWRVHLSAPWVVGGGNFFSIVNAPPFAAARPEKLLVPAECFNGSTPVARCGF